jgi:hypothetical protein
MSDLSDILWADIITCQFNSPLNKKNRQFITRHFRVQLINKRNFSVINVINK